MKPQKNNEWCNEPRAETISFTDGMFGMDCDVVECVPDTRNNIQEQIST